MKLYKDKNWLYQKYIVDNVSMYRLAKTQNVSVSTIRYHLIKFNIKIRNKEQSINPNIRPYYRHKHWLFNQYVNERKAISEIAKICNATLMTISNHLKKFNIKTRNQSQAFIEWKRNQIKLGKKYLDLNWLKEKGKKLNNYEIAKMLNVSPGRIRHYANLHNIKIKIKEPELTERGRKSLSESHKGVKNFRWNNGASEYKNHSELKRNRIKALKRDEHKCKFCNKKATETHHKDETKENHDIDNLISVCHKCHINQFHKHKKTTSKYRRLYGMSLQEMSNKANLSGNAILDYFNKKHKAHVETKFKIRELTKELGIKQ